MTRQLEAYLARETNNKDPTDDIFDLLSSISESVQEELDELISGDSDKKRFLRALSRIFANFSTQKSTQLKKSKEF